MALAFLCSNLRFAKVLYLTALYTVLILYLVFLLGNYCTLLTKRCMMQKINELFTPGQESVLGAVRKAAEQTRKYERKDPLYCTEKPKRARFKLWVMFDNQTEPRIFYSYDYASDQGKTKLDEWLGYTKLLRALQKWDGKYKTAVIYCSHDPQADTNKKTYNGVGAKFTKAYKRHNPTIEFGVKTRNGVKHSIMRYDRFDGNYFKPKNV